VFRDFIHMIDLHPSPANRAQPELAGDYDVIVIGGGPAGSTVAALTAEFGHRVLVLERSTLPRFHLGESLIPETYGTLQRLGLIERMQETAFPKKYSVQFVGGDGKESAPFYFDEYKPHASSQTWQVERSEFDALLLQRAEELGAVVRTNAQVLSVQFDGEQATGVEVKLSNQKPGFSEETGFLAASKPGRSRKDSSPGHPYETKAITAKVIVDATGQSAFLVNRLGLKIPDERLKKGTVWSYFRGALRDSGRDEGATIILQTEGQRSWFWYIPLPDDIVSVGCTGDIDQMFGSGRGKPEET